jgi:hypothetical protein
MKLRMSRRTTYILTALFVGLVALGLILFWPSPVLNKQGPIDSPVGDAIAAANTEAPDADTSAVDAATAVPVTTPPAPAVAVPVGVALTGEAPRKVVIRVLDKITQRLREYELDMDQSVRFGIIDVRVRTCIATPPYERPENSAFVQIDETRQGRPKQRIFSGWMFSSTPSLNPLQHPIYDVWVIKCKMSFPDKGPDTVEVSAVSDVEKRGTGDSLEEVTGKPAKKAPRAAAKPSAEASAPAAAEPAEAPSPPPAAEPTPQD